MQIHLNISLLITLALCPFVMLSGRGKGKSKELVQVHNIGEEAVEMRKKLVDWVNGEKEKRPNTPTTPANQEIDKVQYRDRVSKKKPQNNVDRISSRDIEQPQNNVDRIRSPEIEQPPRRKPQNNVDRIRSRPIEQPQNNVDRIRSRPIEQPQNNVDRIRSRPIEQPQNNVDRNRSRAIEHPPTRKSSSKTTRGKQPIIRKRNEKSVEDLNNLQQEMTTVSQHFLKSKETMRKEAAERLQKASACFARLGAHGRGFTEPTTRGQQIISYSNMPYLSMAPSPYGQKHRPKLSGMFSRIVRRLTPNFGKWRKNLENCCKTNDCHHPLDARRFYSDNNDGNYNYDYYYKNYDYANDETSLLPSRSVSVGNTFHSPGSSEDNAAIHPEENANVNPLPQLTYHSNEVLNYGTPPKSHELNYGTPPKSHELNYGTPPKTTYGIHRSSGSKSNTPPKRNDRLDWSRNSFERFDGDPIQNHRTPRM